jgi:cellulose synthase/poly-beta-1,6-N-acetylglucosamine synthase-like glycosyltransferase
MMMHKLNLIIFWISFLAFIYIYFGYFIILKIINLIKKADNSLQVLSFLDEDCPQVSIIVAAFNEEKKIKYRIENLLSLDYPKGKLEIIIASDGSVDKTVEIARQYEPNGILVANYKYNKGRAITHNEVMKFAKGEIILFTDADTEFTIDSLKGIVKYFSYHSSGCVVGNLIYLTSSTPIEKSEGFYWKLEKTLRELESNLGILATSTGAFMAIRKKLWKDLSPIDDADFITPLDVIHQGYKVVYAPDALAFDKPVSTATGELLGRIRQTSKNFSGTLKRWGWKSLITHPLISLGLLSHKFLRWLTIFFLMGAFISNYYLIGKGSFYDIIFKGQIIIYMTAMVGLLGEIFSKRIIIASNIFSFCLACIGMGIGVIKGILGKAPASYV